MTDRNYTCEDNTKQRSKRIPHNKRTQEQFIKIAIEKHGSRYGYERTKYINNITKVKIDCPVHGEFEQTPKHHLRGEGCFQCGRDTTGRKKTKTTEDFIKDAVAVHGPRYNYSKTKYKGAALKLDVVCYEHGQFSQKATHHLGGTGCPCCANEVTGWSRGNFKRACNGDEGHLYVIHCQSKSESFYKVGITSRSVSERFKGTRDMPYEYHEILTLSGASDYIYDLEKQLHSTLRKHRYTPEIYFNGRTECFETIELIKNLLK